MGVLERLFGGLWPSVLLREWRVAARGRWFYAVRVVAVLAVAGVPMAAIATESASQRQTSTMGLDIFAWAVAAAMIVGAVVTPFVVIGHIQGMVRDRVMGPLAMSDVGLGRAMGEQIVAMLTLSLAVQVGCLPVYLICLSLGGLVWQQVVGGVYLVMCVVVLGTGIGYVAAITGRNRAVWVAGGMLGVGLVLNTMVSWMRTFLYAMPYAWRDMVREVLGGFSMVESLDRLLAGQVDEALLAPTIYGAAGVALMVLGRWLAVRLIDRLEGPVKPPGEGIVRKVMRRMNRRKDAAPDVWQRMSRTALGTQNPVVWREYKRYGGDLKHWLWMVVVMLGWFAGHDFIGIGWRETRDMAAWGLALFGVLAVWRLISMHERHEERGTLELVLLTAMKPRELLLDKVMVGIRPMLPWLMGAAVLVVLPRYGFRTVYGEFYLLMVVASVGAYGFGLLCFSHGLIEDGRMVRLLLMLILLLDMGMMGASVMEGGNRLRVSDSMYALVIPVAVVLYLWLLRQVPYLTHVLVGLGACLTLWLSLIPGEPYQDDEVFLVALVLVGGVFCSGPWGLMTSMKRGKALGMLVTVGGPGLMLMGLIMVSELHSTRHVFDGVYGVVMALQWVVGHVGWLLLVSRWEGWVLKREE